MLRYYKVESGETATSALAITPVMYHYIFMTVRFTDGGYNRALCDNTISCM